MDLAQAVEDLKQHFEAFKASAEEKLEQTLPVVADAAQKLSGNPVVAALAGAAHINDAPELLNELASIITKADAALAASKAAGAAEAQQAAQAAAQPPQAG
jgi:hypothetical protein